MEDIQVASIRKNARDELRIAIREYEGHIFVDIRQFSPYRETGQMGPTPKGVAVRPQKLKALIDALEAAEKALNDLAEEAA